MYGGRLDARQLEFGWKWIAGPVLVALVGIMVVEAAPAWSAHLGHGRSGVWTVTDIKCAKRSCTPIGDFAAADGTDLRRAVRLAGGAVDAQPGSRFTAVDTGDPDGAVYPPGGGSAWLKYTVGAIVVSAPAGLWVWVYPITGIKRLLRSRRGAPVPRV